MQLLDLQEYTSYPRNVSLNKDQRRALTADARVEVMPSPDQEGAYRLRPSSYIGALNMGRIGRLCSSQGAH